MANDKYSIFVIQPVVPGTFAGQTAFTASETRWGGTVGAGVEFGFAPHWSVAVEYDHLFLGNRNVQLNSIGLPFLPFVVDRIGQNADIGTVQVNYGFGGPAVSKF